MKELLVFVVCFVFIAEPTFSQVRVRKVPFLPYAGMTVSTERQQASTSTRGIVDHRKSAQPSGSYVPKKEYDVIYFDENAKTIRADQYASVEKTANHLIQVDAKNFSVVGFYTPEITSQLAKERIDVLISALRDFGVQGNPVVNLEYKKTPVVNPNRVEVYRSVNYNLSNASGLSNSYNR